VFPSSNKIKIVIQLYIVWLRTSCSVIQSLLPFLSVVPLFFCQIPLIYRLSYSYLLCCFWSFSLSSSWRYPFHYLFPLPEFISVHSLHMYQINCFFSTSFIMEPSIPIPCLTSSFLKSSFFSLHEILIDRRIVFISVASNIFLFLSVNLHVLQPCLALYFLPFL